MRLHGTARVHASFDVIAPGQDRHCLLEAAQAALEEEPRLQAIRFHPADQQVAIATLGVTDAGLEERVATRLKGEGAGESEGGCRLLLGESECGDCPRLHAGQPRAGFTLSQEEGWTTLARPTCPTAPRFWRWREVSWPRLVPRRTLEPEEADYEREWKGQMLAAVICGLLGLAGWLFPWERGVSPVFIAAYVAGSWFAASEAWKRLHRGVVDVHFLMLAVAGGSAAIGAWGEGAVLLFLFSLSGALEHYAMGRTEREIRSLFRAAPRTATLIEEGGERLVPVEQLIPGMRILVRPGELFPADAELREGRTAVDESTLSGESVPADKERGDVLFAGTLNLWGAVEGRVLKPAGESAIQRVIQLIREAQQRRAPVQRFTDRFGTPYTYGLLGLSLGMFLVWWLGWSRPPFVSTPETASAFYRAMTLLVVGSPCALVLSIPSAILAAIAWAARRGVLFRGGAALEKLADTTLVAMDKTGTLTTGELRVERVESIPPGREDEVAILAYSLERLSNHPLARAITRDGRRRGLRVVEVGEVESLPGLGLRTRSGEGEALLGRREWVEEESGVSLRRTGPEEERGFSEVWLVAGTLVGRVLLRDEVRPEAAELVRRLRELGLRTVVLTGDRGQAADRLGEELGLDDVRSGLSPEGKVDVLRELAWRGERVAMIGDGVNDAPSLAAAQVGVAMGARGSDAALEQADIVLMHDRLENFLTAFQLSGRTRRIIRQNLLISLGTVIVLGLAALAGQLPLTVGVLGHEGSTVVVVVNSLRLLVRGGGG
jgi:Cd2+/Zn2+-exporting ATPase